MRYRRFELFGVGQELVAMTEHGEYGEKAKEYHQSRKLLPSPALRALCRGNQVGGKGGGREAESFPVDC